MNNAMVLGLSRWILKRILLGLATLVFVCVVIFIATQVLPGDAARAILGRSATPERLEAVRQSLNLDQPAVWQFLLWAKGILHGDPGLSLASQLPVVDVIAPKLRNTVTLVVLVSLIGIPLSILAGVFAAIREGRPFDTFLSVLALTLAALPEFIVGMILILMFSTVVFQWFPPVSLVPPGRTLWDVLPILVLPVATLVLIIFPYLFRMIRSSMRGVLRSEYIEMAHLKGVGKRRLIWMHALPNAIGPTFQVIGLTVNYLAGGVVITEYLFGFPGIGQLLLDAVKSRDVPVIQFIVLLLAGFYVVVNMLADLATVLVTPRLRIREGRA